VSTGLASARPVEFNAQELIMNDIEKTVCQFYESWDLRIPERGVAVIAAKCNCEDVMRGEAQTGPDGYREDYHRWCATVPDGEVKVVNVIIGEGGWAVV
jgi:predicted ester cyclase